MNTAFRFGRRLPLPSTAQILHELKALGAQEAARERYALSDGLPITATWLEIGLHRAQLERDAQLSSVADESASTQMREAPIIKKRQQETGAR
jgi:hypothetical protein